jgi:hypothetical protein
MLYSYVWWAACAKRGGGGREGADRRHKVSKKYSCHTNILQNVTPVPPPPLFTLSGNPGVWERTHPPYACARPARLARTR